VICKVRRSSEYKKPLRQAITSKYI